MKKKGWGLGCMIYGIGNTGMPNPSGAFVDILKDGSVIVYTGCADIGQGSTTIMAQIAAEVLGLDVDRITVVSADTLRTPEAGATSASRQTYITGNAVKKAVESARTLLAEKAAEILGLDKPDLIFRDNEVYSSSEPQKTLLLNDLIRDCYAEGAMILGFGTFNPEITRPDRDTGEGVPYGTYSFATQYAEVEVDTETGEVSVLKLVAAHDVGRAINPQLVEGQIEGGCVMGLGYTLTEELILSEGKILNPDLQNYLLPTAADVPGSIEALIVEDPEETGPFGAKGVGEPPLVPTSPAIANAISNALGVRFTELPITPEKIVKALNPEYKQGDFLEGGVNADDQ